MVPIVASFPGCLESTHFHRSRPIMRYQFQIIVSIAVAIAFPSNSKAQPNTAPTKVAITPEHVLSINGKKLFPIGFTIPPPLGGKTPQGKPAFEELRSAGAVFIRTGPMWDEDKDRKYFEWNTEWAEREKKYMQAAARAGIYCMPWLKELA